MPRVDGSPTESLLDGTGERASLRTSLAAIARDEAKAAREAGVFSAALRWVTVAVIHGLVGTGLALGMRELYFGSAETECHGAVLRSCEDDQRWEWNLDGRKLHERCSAFAPTANHSLHEYCSSATSSDGVLAKDACTTACSTCGLNKFIEIVIAGAPIWARNALIGAVVVSSCSRLSGFERRSGLLRRLLMGHAEAEPHAMIGGTLERDDVQKAGWNAIVGRRVGDAGPQPQSTWAEARDARSLTQQQARASALTKLFLWHWSQPVAYLLVLWGYRCYVAALGLEQRNLAAVVAAREVVYLASTLLAAWQTPAFLLLDLAAAWNEAESTLERIVRMAIYVLTPHNYTAFCLANRFRSWRRTFLGMAGIQVIADLASCVALAALMAGGIEEEAKKPPAAMKIGYIITAFGFLLFFGPLSVAGSLGGAFDRSKYWCLRTSSAVAGSLVLCGWICIVTVFIMLIAEQDVFCKASEWGIITDPCHGHGTCYAAAQCHCDEGYGPEVSFNGEDLCACKGADKKHGCGEHGRCMAIINPLRCNCETGYSGEQCGRGIGCDDNPCGIHGSCTPNGGSYTCSCNGEWSGSRCSDDPCTLHNNCGDHGDCHVGKDGHVCNCHGEWFGSTCSDDPCAHHNNCGEHGDCQVDGDGHSCSCTDGWSGDRCDHPTGCDASPCGSHGTCTADGGQYECMCSCGWSGANCQVDPDPGGHQWIWAADNEACTNACAEYGGCGTSDRWPTLNRSQFECVTGHSCSTSFGPGDAGGLGNDPETYGSSECWYSTLRTTCGGSNKGYRRLCWCG